jgi:hypothetical protein
MFGIISRRSAFWIAIAALLLAACGPGAEEGTPESAMPTEWDVYRDQTFSFEVPYPADWTYTEADISQAGEVPLERVLNFWPPEYKTGVPPISVEVAHGTQDMMTMWPITGAEEYTQTVLYDKDVLIAGGIRGDIFYILRDPADSQLWVAIRDSITFSVVNQPHDIVDRMVEGFQFFGR